MKSKPITPERRAEIKAWDFSDSPEPERQVIQELLDAEEWWRKEIAGRDPLGAGDYYGDSECFFCLSMISPTLTDEDGNAIQQHKPDCPWVLANKRSAE